MGVHVCVSKYAVFHICVSLSRHTQTELAVALAEPKSMRHLGGETQ